MVMKKQLVEDVNILSRFLARRDMEDLHAKALYERYGIKQVDLIVVLGNSMPYIALMGAKAYKEGLSKDFMIVGGRGHSTKYLIENVLSYENGHEFLLGDRSEAGILKELVVRRLGLNEEEVLIETQSENCGSNAFEALRLLRENGNVPKTVLLLQDPTMQRRSHASFVKEWGEEETLFISYAAFVPKLLISEGKVLFANKEIPHLWKMDRFLDLVLGEIPRLKDDEHGYGPNGRGFIAHVEVPKDVLAAYEQLTLEEHQYKRAQEM